jgi:enamine deaminase RidA (YjgF/YER057c/UK114 family)
MPSATERLHALGIQLPAIHPPVGNYVHAVRTGNLLFLEGTGSGQYRGKVGREVTVDQANEYARSTGLMLLAVMAKELGSLDRITRIVKVTGFVNAVPDFTSHTRVVDGCSDLFVEVFGERGRHARMAMGAGSAPDQVPLEIEVVVECEIMDARHRGIQSIWGYLNKGR